MKNLSTFIIFLVLVTTTWAQTKIYSFEDAKATNYFGEKPYCTGTGSVTYSDETSLKHDGTKAMKVEWVMNSSESWGGSIGMEYKVPVASKKHLDFSMAKQISLWYNNTVPSNKNGAVQMRLKLHDAGGSSAYWNGADRNAQCEDWYFQSALVYDATPGWKELIIPLKDLGEGGPQNDLGFSLPGWSGTKNNGVLDLDKIVGYTIEWTSGVIGGDNLAQGTVYYDDMTLQGSQYTPLYLFENSTEAKGDNMSWASGNKGVIALSNETADLFEGKASLKLDYKVHASESWGGYGSFQVDFPSNANISSNQNLYLAVKNVKANTLKGKVTVRFELIDKGSAAAETWYTLLDVDIDQVFGWSVIQIPLVATEVQSWDIKKGIFVNPSGQSPGGNNKFDLNAISGFKVEYSVGVQTNDLAEGTTLFDFLVPAGYQETDKTAPVAVKGLTVTTGAYSNLVLWQDVPNETGEKYDVYFSNKVITDVKAVGVEVVKLGIQENAASIDHVLKAPKTDQNTTYYYAIVCTDKAGNVGSVSATSTGITNKAKGVPTLTLATVNFKADGKLDEWSAITPITMKTSNATAFLATPESKVDNDADISAKAYIAIDKQFLYVAFDVDDDIVNPDVKTETYLNDSPDLFIGLYDAHGMPHTSYGRGKTPDYHFRFNKAALRNDSPNSAVAKLLEPGANYYWDAKFPTGYIVEAKIPLADLMNKRDAASDALDAIYVKEGFRIPIDFSINDNDSGNRDAIVTYSNDNKDQSWADVSRWTNTWLGDKWEAITGTEDNSLPVKYSLDQNYPNPFNPTTKLKYSIMKPGFVTLKVYDVLGREVANLVNEFQNSGSYNLNFDASKLSSGVYLYTISSGDFVQSKKMLLIK
ncbi:MAG: sugar-binding protein [Ignavibacteria bacterium]|nr:sugar-binding protein [Ignavibacteria bacterium]